MTAQATAYWVVVVLSAFSIGSVGFAAWLEVRLAKQLHSVRTFRAMMKLGYMLVTGTILWVVLPARGIPVSAFYWVYIVGLALGGIGGIGTVFTTIRVYVKYQPDV